MSDPALLHIRVAELANMYRMLKEELATQRKEHDKAIAILKSDVEILKTEICDIKQKS